MLGLHNGTMMDLELVRAFVVVLEEGSLNRAALRLHVAQSSLTRKMQALERALGGRLLERTSGGVAPTAAGQGFADSVRRLLPQFDAAWAEAGRIARGERVGLRVGYMPTISRAYLNPALGTLRRAHPHVKVQLLDLAPGEQIEALRKGEIELAITGSEGAMLAREFYTRRIARMPVALGLPEDHRLAARPSLKLADLRGESFVVARDRDVPGFTGWLNKLFRRAGFRPRIAFESESLMHAFSLVVSEGVLVCVPHHPDNAAVGMVFRPIADASVYWDFFASWQRGHTAPAVQVLIRALVDAGRRARFDNFAPGG